MTSEWKDPIKEPAIAGCGLCSDDEDYGDDDEYGGGDCKWQNGKKTMGGKNGQGLGYKPFQPVNPNPGFQGPKGLGNKPFNPQPNPKPWNPNPGWSNKPSKPWNPKPNPGWSNKPSKPWKPGPGYGNKWGKWYGHGPSHGPGYWNNWRRSYPRTRRYAMNWAWNPLWGAPLGFGPFQVGPSLFGNGYIGWFNPAVGFVPFSWGLLLDPIEVGGAGWPLPAACAYYQQLLADGAVVEPPPGCGYGPRLTANPAIISTPALTLGVNAGPFGATTGIYANGGGPLDAPEDWDATVDYLSGEIVLHNGQRYMASETMISNPKEPGTSGAWDVLTSVSGGNNAARKTVMASDPIEAWDWAFNYQQGAQATDHGKLYRAKVNVLFGDFAVPRDRPTVWAEVMTGGLSFRFKPKSGGAKIKKPKKLKSRKGPPKPKHRGAIKKPKPVKQAKSSATTSKDLVSEHNAILVKHKYNYDTWSQFPTQTLTALLFHISENYDSADAVAFKIPRSPEERKNREQFGSVGDVHKKIMDGLSQVFSPSDIVIASDGTIILLPSGIATLKKFVRK